VIRNGIAALWLSLLSLTGIAQAQTSVVVVVPHVDTNDYESFEHRLRSELVAEGFEPVSVEVPGEVDAQTLQRNANRFMSPAAISISIHARVVSGLVWIRARGKSDDSLRSVPDYPLGEQASAVFAVRATDVLHGGLLELGYIGVAPEPAEPPAPKANDTSTSKLDDSNATPAASKPEPPEPPRPPVARTAPPAPLVREQAPLAWRATAMGTLGSHFLDFPSNLGLSLSVMRRLNQYFSFGIAGTLFAPVVIRTEPDQGRAYITQAFVGPRLQCLQPLTEAFTLFEYLESGPHAIVVSGEAVRPNISNSDQSFTIYSSLGLGASWTPNQMLGVIAQAGILAPWRRTDVVILNTAIAEAAGPALLFSGGLQLAF
jgi:hypothetical protein